MKITDIIRGVLDLVDAGQEQTVAPEISITPVDAEEPCGSEPMGDTDLVDIIKQLAGLESEPSAMYANEPNEVVAPIGAAFPGGDGIDQRKNPADIRTNAPSMYPGFQAETR